MNPAPEAPSHRGLTFLGRWGGAAVVLLVALPLRLTGFRAWWLNPDEGIYYSLVTRSTAAGFWSEVMANAHPPLYYLILRGLGHLTWDFTALRAFSLVCGLAAVYAVWLSARELAGGGWRGVVAGLLAALVAATAPGAVVLSQIMRPYALQLALLSGALWLLLRRLRTGSGRDAAGYLTLLCLALLTHYGSVLALGAFGTVVAFHVASRGWRARDARRLALLHGIPAALVAGLYVFHLGPLAESRLADQAIHGWLSYYMAGSGGEAWLAFLGFHGLLAGPWLQAPLALLLVAAMGLSAAGPDRRPLVVGGAAVLIALVAAALGAYPLGATRHALWLAAFTLPVLGWGAARLLDLPRRARMPALGAVAALLVLGGPVGRWVGRLEAPWAPTERVLRWADMARMVDVLDPGGQPRLVLMSAQTFYTLLPLYPKAREQASFSADSSLFRFTVGRRDVVAATAWTFTDPGADGPSVEGGRDLAEALAAADEAFPEAGLGGPGWALLLVGGWRPPLVDALARRSGDPAVVLGRREVPGLSALLLDLQALHAAPPPPSRPASGAAG